MRVLTIGSMYPPHHLGGYEIAWRGAVERLREAGHTVRVLASDYRLADAADPDDDDVHRELRSYWRDHEFPRRSLIGRAALERHNGRVFDRHLDDFQPDLLSWWAMGGMSLSLLERGRRRGVPALGVVSDDWLIYGPDVDQWTRTFAGRRRLAALAERLTGVPTCFDPPGALDSWVFVSRTTLSRAEEVGFRGSSVQVVHLGIDADLFQPREQSEWRWRLLYLGRLDRRKGIDLAILALPMLPEATLTVIGAGDDRYRAELEALARDHGVAERVTFRRSPREQLPDRYAEADAVLFPVRWSEPWGLVPLEAMAVGRPVIATGKGGSGEYLEDGRNCLLFDPADGAPALAAAVMRLSEDAALRADLVERGRRTASRFPADAFGEAVGRLSVRLAQSR